MARVTDGFVVGVGARSGVSAAELAAALDAALAEAGVAGADVRKLATIDRRAEEDSVRAVADRNGWQLHSFTASELSAQDVPHRSGTVAAAVGTPSVAEAAALAAGDEGNVLLLPKRVFGGVTVAVSGPPRPGR